MDPKDIEQLLINAKYTHLSEATLVSYRDNEFDKVGLALADAHLKRCLICTRKLTFLKEEQEANENYVLTEKDRALIAQARKKVESIPRATEPITTRIQQAVAYFNDLLTAWIRPFSKPAMRGGEDGEVIWEYESADGVLKAWAVSETDFSLTVHFESIELTWEGIRIQFRLGPFSKEVTLEREGDSKVVAKIEIPRRKLARKMYDISIEIL